jgi:malic enzyme
VTLAGMLTSMRALGKPIEAIRDQRIVCLGAGSAGLGVCNAIMMARLSLSLSLSLFRFNLVFLSSLPVLC